MKRLLDVMVGVCVLTGLGLIAWAGYGYWEERIYDGEPFAVENPMQELAKATGPSTEKVAFTVRNLGARPIKVVGAEQTCGDKNCCLRAELPNHVHIPPGSAAAVPFEVTIRGPGEFSHQVKMFIADGRWLRETTVGVRGVAAAKEPGAAKEPQSPAP